jgi:hypothetical protein
MATTTGVDADQSAHYLAQVRRLLRQREYRQAIEVIDRRLTYVVEAAAGVPVQDVRSYAYERLVRIGPNPSRRAPVNLRRGVPVSLRRPIMVDLRRLTRAELERVLGWLLAGELRAAEDALHAGEQAVAVRAAEFAARVDDRSTRVARVHARALYELAVAALNGPSPDLDDVLGQLHRAARLANRAAADPDPKDPDRKLPIAIKDLVTTVERRRSRTAQADAVTSVVRRFNRLVRHYSDRDQIVSHVQLGNARASLAQITADAERLSSQHPAESPAGQALADLRRQSARYRAHLERLGRSVRPD